MVDISVETDRPRSGISSANLRPGRAFCKRGVLALSAGLSVLLGLSACRTEGRPPSAPLDPVVDAQARGDGGASRPAPRSFGEQNDLCFGLLTAEQDDDLARRACATPLPTDEDEGILAFPCTGEGLAQATLGERRLEGPILAPRAGRRRFDVREVRAVEHDDGCRWEVFESLMGEVAEDAATLDQPLTWTHTERRLEGVGCRRACAVTAAVSYAPAPDVKDIPR